MITKNLIASQFLPQTKVTPLQVKIKAKEIKQKRQIKDITQRPKAEQIYIQERVTIANHCIEFLNDLIDELINLQLIKTNHLLADMQKELLILQKYFIEKSIEEGNEEERRKQQKRFEEVFTKVSKMKAKKLNKLIELIEEL